MSNYPDPLHTRKRGEEKEMKASDSRFRISYARIASNRCSVPVKLSLSKRLLPPQHKEPKPRNPTLAMMSEVQIIIIFSPVAIL